MFITGIFSDGASKIPQLEFPTRADAFLNMFIGVVVNVIEEETNLSKITSSTSPEDAAELQRQKMLEGIEVLRNEISTMREDNPPGKQK